MRLARPGAGRLWLAQPVASVAPVLHDVGHGRETNADVVEEVRRR
jgi:hypothetical protein